MFLTNTELCARWISAKEAEKEAIDRRRAIEDALLSFYGVEEGFEGSQTLKEDEYKIKMTGRANRKINGDRLQALAEEAGVSEHLSTLFRWTPSINAKAWQAADPSITGPLTEAITTTPGRVSFAITMEEE
jgi:hypothetical protein